MCPSLDGRLTASRSAAKLTSATPAGQWSCEPARALPRADHVGLSREPTTVCRVTTRSNELRALLARGGVVVGDSAGAIVLRGSQADAFGTGSVSIVDPARDAAKPYLVMKSGTRAVAERAGVTVTHQRMKAISGPNHTENRVAPLRRTKASNGPPVCT
jgi:hypothetical protein